MHLPAPCCRRRRSHWRRYGGSYGSPRDVPRLAVQCGCGSGANDEDAALSWSTCCSSLFLLGLFDRDLFVRVADTLALVGLRWTNSTNLSSDLTDTLTICTLDHHFRGRRGGNRDACGHFDIDRMRIANSQIQLRA